MVEEQSKGPPAEKFKDNRVKAIAFMNLCAIGGVASSILFKVAAF